MLGSAVLLRLISQAAARALKNTLPSRDDSHMYCNALFLSACFMRQGGYESHVAPNTVAAWSQVRRVFCRELEILLKYLDILGR